MKVDLTSSGTAGAPTASAPPPLTANLFGIPFGMAGLALCWSTAYEQAGVGPSWAAEVVWMLCATTWVTLTIAYIWAVALTRRFLSEATDAVFAPFTALLLIIPMTLSVALAGHADTAGRVLFLLFLGLTVAYGGWLTGQWMLTELTLAQWHPGYFLPTVAGGLIGAGGCAALGYDGLARLMFGYGTICWLAIGSIILLRLFTQPPLPQALAPTMAIELAPPVVAGSAWFAMNGERIDTVALALSGYAILMVCVQLRLLPLYARLPFTPGWWAFSFSYAAGCALAIRWVSVAEASPQWPLVASLLAAITVGVGALAARTVAGLIRGTFLPGAPALTSGGPVMSSPQPGQPGAVR